MQEFFELALAYLRSTWRYRWYALGVAWLFCLGGWAYVYKMPDEHQASARVYVDTQSVLRPLLSGMTIQFNPASQISLMTRTLLTRPNLEKVARMTDLDLQAKDSTSMDRLLDNLKSHIRLEVAGRQDLYNIAFSDPNPELAKKVVQALLTIFVENSLGETRQDTDSAQRFIDKLISDYEARLVAAENRLVEFKRRNAGVMSNSEGGYYSRMESAFSQLESARLVLRQAEERRDSLKRQIDGEEPVFGMVPITAGGPSAIKLPVDARIEALQQRLDEFLLRYTEKHPDVSILRQTIAELQEQREQELARYSAMNMNSSADAGAPADVNTNPVYQQLKIALANEEANLAALQAQVGIYEKRLQEMQQKINTVPEIEAQLKALDRDYNALRHNYDALIARREQARLSQEAEQNTDDIRFRVIEPPRVPTEPTGPNRTRFMSMVLAAGLSTGLGIAFLIGQLLPTFDNRRHLMQATNIPVFGTVGIILSASAVRRQRLLLIVYCALFVLLLAAYAGLVVAEISGFRPL